MNKFDWTGIDEKYKEGWYEYLQKPANNDLVVMSQLQTPLMRIATTLVKMDETEGLSPAALGILKIWAEEALQNQQQ